MTREEKLSDALPVSAAVSTPPGLPPTQYTAKALLWECCKSCNELPLCRSYSPCPSYSYPRPKLTETSTEGKYTRKNSHIFSLRFRKPRSFIKYIQREVSSYQGFIYIYIIKSINIPSIHSMISFYFILGGAEITAVRQG